MCEKHGGNSEQGMWITKKEYFVNWRNLCLWMLRSLWLLLPLQQVRPFFLPLTLMSTSNCNPMYWWLICVYVLCFSLSFICVFVFSVIDCRLSQQTMMYHHHVQVLSIVSHKSFVKLVLNNHNHHLPTTISTNHLHHHQHCPLIRRILLTAVHPPN